MRKKILVGVVAVGIAAMLVALPYESNAFAWLALGVGIGIGVAVGVGSSILYHWLTDKSDKHNVDYVVDENANAYINNWKSYLSHWENVVSMTNMNSNNYVNLYSGLKLYWTRIAERNVIDVLNYTNWTKAKENMSAFVEFNNFTKSIVNNILSQYALIYGDLTHEFNGMCNITFDDTSKYAYVQWRGSGALCTAEFIKTGQWYYGSWNKHNITKIHMFLDKTSWAYYYSLNDNGYLNATNIKEIMLNTSDGISISIRNMSNTDLENMLTDAGNVHVCVAFVLNNNKMWIAFDTFLRKMMYNKVADASCSINICYHNLTAGKTYSYSSSMSIKEWVSSLSNAYEEIRDAMDLNAHTYWTTLHNMGYYNASDVPANLTLPLPDVYLQNFDRLGNMSSDDALAFYYAVMRQLEDELNNLIENNETGNVTWNNISIGNFSGNKVNISLQKVNADGSSITTYFDGHWCYVIPYEKTLQLDTNKTYAITLSNATLSWADEKIMQDVTIFDLQTMKYYTIYAVNDTFYKMHVYGCMENNESVDSITINITNPDDLSNYMFGFRFTPLTYDTPEDTVVIPITNNDSWLDWITQHKSFITIALIVLGMLMMAGSRKGSGSYTIGMLLFIAGVGMAFYWYILPSWHELQNLNPLNWFK
ncbi:hypothetical protein B6U81_01750 [Thermoplasmatales archaeon ex4484_30]|nr:MAG: hypothetical protein B6U81_01750 [Thermoplasmatales archaeon ex4484_30]